jgi:predicted nucleic acid-binding protein
MPVLADINVLLARFDRKHPHHKRVNRFFARERFEAVAACPLTVNGFVIWLKAARPRCDRPVEFSLFFEVSNLEFRVLTEA